LVEAREQLGVGAIIERSDEGPRLGALPVLCHEVQQDYFSSPGGDRA
jgi:hypothetical protein